MRYLCGVTRACLFALLFTVSIASGDNATPDADLRAKLELYQDGKGHFVALSPTDTKSRLWYGNKTSMSAVSVDPSENTGPDQNGDWKRWFVDPRFVSRRRITDYKQIEASTTMVVREGTSVAVRCGARKTPLTAVADPAAYFQAVRFEARSRPVPYALARDANGKYYYVDRAETRTASASSSVHAAPSNN
jgi:hypothetical protein